MNSLLKFADDTKIYGRVQNVNDRLLLQQDLDKLFQWSKDWQMEFNINKCKVMHLGKGNRKYEYYMNGQELEVVQEEKDLGILVSDNLKSSGQCLVAYKKANQALGMIKRTITYKHQTILLDLYKTLVRPYLEYCTPAWSPHYRKDIQLLEKVQHRFTRMISNVKHLSYDERLKVLGLWTLE